MQCIHKCSGCPSSIIFASCKWGFCAKMFAIQRYWGSFHSCVRSRTGVNAESKRVKMRFAGVVLRNKCVFDSSLASFDFWIAIPRRQRNCYRGCTASCLIFKAKKIKLAVAKQTLDSAENHKPNANNTFKQIYFMCFIKCYNWICWFTHYYIKLHLCINKLK